MNLAVFRQLSHDLKITLQKTNYPLASQDVHKHRLALLLLVLHLTEFVEVFCSQITIYAIVWQVYCDSSSGELWDRAATAVFHFEQGASRILTRSFQKT